MAKNLELARLFVTLEAETKGLDGQLSAAERSLGRTAKFIQANPVAALGAMAAAVVAVGAQATAMAAEVDTALRRVTQKVPGAQAAFAALKDVARELSIEFGLAQTQVVGVMDAIAEGGISSAADLEAATRAVVLAQKASGKEFEVLVQSLDTSLDAFGLSAKDSETILADLLATAKGSTNIADLSEVLKKVGPAAKAAGLDFQTTIAAIAAMQTQVTDTRGQVKLFRDVLANDGVASLNAYADAVRPAGDALKAMKDAAAENNATIGSLQDQLKQRFNATMIDLGTAILPVATAAMQGFVNILTFFSDDARAAKASTKLDEVSAAVRNLGAAARDNNQVVERLAETLKNMAGNLRSGDFVQSLEGFTNDKLVKLRDEWQLVANNTDKASFRMAEAKSAIGGIQKELANRFLRDYAEDAGKSAAGTKALNTEVVKGIPPLKSYSETTTKISEAEKQAAEDRKVLAERTATLTEINNILNDQTLQFLGTAKSALKKLGDEMLAAGATTDQVRGLLGPLVKKVEELEKKNIKQPFKEALDTTEKLDAATAAVAVNVGQLVVPQGLPVDVQEIAGNMIHIADAALGAAAQFGIISGETYQALGHILDISSSINALKGASFTQVLAGLPGIISSLTGLLGTVLGESPADRERRKILEANTGKLAELVRVNGDLVNASSPGRTIAGVGRALGKGEFIQEEKSLRFGTLTGKDKDRLGQALIAQGLTFADLDKVAGDLGLTIRDKEGKFVTQSLAQLIEFISKADTGALGTFSGKLGSIDTGLQIGAINKGDEFGAVLKAAGSDNAIAGILAGLDVTKAPGRAQAADELKQVFRELAEGKVSLDQLGGLSRKEFEELLVRLVGILNSDQQINSFDLGTNSTRAEAPALSVALDDGFSGLSDLTVTSNTYLDGILRTLQSFSPFAAPALPGASAGGGSAGGGLGAVAVGGISVVINAAPGQSEESIGAAVMDAIERQLAVRLQAAQDLLGSVVRS